MEFPVLITGKKKCCTWKVMKISWFFSELITDLIFLGDRWKFRLEFITAFFREIRFNSNLGSSLLEFLMS